VCRRGNPTDASGCGANVVALRRATFFAVVCSGLIGVSPNPKKSGRSKREFDEG